MSSFWSFVYCFINFFSSFTSCGLFAFADIFHSFVFIFFYVFILPFGSSNASVGRSQFDTTRLLLKTTHNRKKRNIHRDNHKIKIVSPSCLYSFLMFLFSTENNWEIKSNFKGIQIKHIVQFGWCCNFITNRIQQQQQQNEVEI